MTVADLAWAGAAVLLGSRHPAVDDVEAAAARSE
jgi:hypothetical protein